MSGGEPLKDIIYKQKMQRSSYIFIDDDKITQDDAQSVNLFDPYRRLTRSALDFTRR